MKEHGLLPDRNHAGSWVDLQNFTLVTCKYRPYKLLTVTRLQLREFLAILHTLSRNSGSEFIGPVFTSTRTKFCKSTLTIGLNWRVFSTFFVGPCFYANIHDHALLQLLGGSDPKTINKYMWPFIQAVFDLNYESEVVSEQVSMYFQLPFFQSLAAYNILTLLPYQICFENRNNGDVGNNCLLSVDGTDFCIAMGYCWFYGRFRFVCDGSWTWN